MNDQCSPEEASHGVTTCAWLSLMIAFADRIDAK
jgi:hypothetical protein